MLVLLLLLLVILEVASSRLVLESWSDLYRDDGSVDLDKLVSQADLLAVTTKPYSECPEVNIDIEEYEVFLMVDGVEVRDTLEKEEVNDIWNTTRTIKSEAEPWILSPIMLR